MWRRLEGGKTLQEFQTTNPQNARIFAICGLIAPELDLDQPDPNNAQATPQHSVANGKARGDPPALDSPSERAAAGEVAGQANTP